MYTLYSKQLPRKTYEWNICCFSDFFNVRSSKNVVLSVVTTWFKVPSSWRRTNTSHSIFCSMMRWRNRLPLRFFGHWYYGLKLIKSEGKDQGGDQPASCLKRYTFGRVANLVSARHLKMWEKLSSCTWEISSSNVDKSGSKKLEQSLQSFFTISQAPFCAHSLSEKTKNSHR